MKKCLLFLLISLFFIHKTDAQIFLKNPSFEGTNPFCSFSIPDYWTVCDDHVLLLGDSINSYCDNIPDWSPHHALSGRTFVELDSRKPNVCGTVAQNLHCPFKQGKQYQFFIFAGSLWGPADSFWSQGLFSGRLQIFLGADSCDKQHRIYKSLPLDSTWNRLSVTYTPTIELSWISFSPDRDSINGMAVILLDTISPIYLINANAVHVANRDTVIYKRGSEQPCVPLHATSSIATFDTVRWYKLVNDTLKVPVANGFSTTQCLDSSTTFLIGMRDSVMGCAGVEWSWDTVRVWVRDTVLGINEGLQTQNASFQLQPNPVKQVLTIAPLFDGPFNWEISDALGRSILRGNGRDETLVNVEPLKRGAYLMKVEGVVRRFLKE